MLQTTIAAFALTLPSPVYSVKPVGMGSGTYSTISTVQEPATLSDNCKTLDDCIEWWFNRSTQHT